MNNLQVNSEIGRLKTVLLHEPGEELNNLIPKYLGDLLFDDIPWLPLAKKEHQAFAQTFIDHGVKVVYLVDLVTEALDSSKEAKEEFINEFLLEADIYSETVLEKVKKYLYSFKSTKELVLKTMSGIKRTELPNYYPHNLADFVGDYPFITSPMPNLYFTRDPFSIISNGVSLNKMFSNVRQRETIYGEFIFKYHKDYKGSPLFYNRDYKSNIEGGDILVLNKETLVLGVSQRTSPNAIEKLAKNLFFSFETAHKTIIALSIPKFRTFMHLDTVLTQVDYDKFAIHQACYNNLKIYKITKDPKKDNKLKVVETKDKLEVVLGEYLNKKITLIPCGGNDSISADREQWSDGSNTIALAPGEVIAYERNDITNGQLKKYGITVYTIPSSELSRGRGGPRCMAMPLEREDIE